MFDFLLRLLFKDTFKLDLGTTAVAPYIPEQATYTCTQGALPEAAPEIQLHILSFLTTREQLLMRQVSRQYKVYADAVIQKKIYAEVANLCLEISNNCVNTPTSKLFELIVKYCDITGRCQQYYGLMNNAEKLKALLQTKGCYDKLSYLPCATLVIRSISSTIGYKAIINEKLKNAVSDLCDSIISLIEKALPNKVQPAVTHTNRSELLLKA
jgi:hypothetical protein